MQWLHGRREDAELFWRTLSADSGCDLESHPEYSMPQFTLAENIFIEKFG